MNTILELIKMEIRKEEGYNKTFTFSDEFDYESNNGEFTLGESYKEGISTTITQIIYKNIIVGELIEQIRNPFCPIFTWIDCIDIDAYKRGEDGDMEWNHNGIWLTYLRFLSC